MIWMIGSGALAFSGTVLMCILIVGGRADERKESLAINSFEKSRGINAFFSLPSSTIPDRVQSAVVHPQQNPLQG
jgi:hypothetical protein